MAPPTSTNPEPNEDTSQEVIPSKGSVSGKEKDMNIPELERNLELTRMKLELSRLQTANMASIQAENKLHEFKKDVRHQRLQAPSKLKGRGNYHEWSMEMEFIAHMLEAEPILENRQSTCPEDIKDEVDRKIWEFKSKTLFNIMCDGLKPSVKEMIWDRIDPRTRNAAELWVVLEREFRDFIFHSRETLTNKLVNMSIADFNGDVIKYIDAFKHTDARLRNLDLEEPLPEWLITDRFIAGLNGHQWDFIQTQKDKARDWRNKGKITKELDLRFIMDCLAIRAYRDRVNRVE